MVLYLSIVFSAMTLICSLNIFLGEPTVNDYAQYIISAVFLCVAVEIAISGIGSLICVRLPNSLFNPNKKLFIVSKKEQRWYEKIGIKHWKNKVWELGGLGGFRKNKLNDANNSEYLYKFIIESNKGMVGHMINICTGFLVIFVLPIEYMWRISIPVALVGAILNLLPIMILRYNLPKLAVAYKRASRLEQRAQAVEVEEEEDETVQKA